MEEPLTLQQKLFDRAEIARVMNAAGTRRDALPQDIQKGLDLGLVSPEVLQNFFSLEQYPLLKELAHRFQYERRKENFFEELDYVITDTARGSVVDFFTVWLPAPTLSFLSYADETNGPDSMDVLKGLLGSIPDNAFQKNLPGKDWNLSHRFASVLLGGLKLSCVGFISSIGAVAASNMLYAIRKMINQHWLLINELEDHQYLKQQLFMDLPWNFSKSALPGRWCSSDSVLKYLDFFFARRACNIALYEEYNLRIDNQLNLGCSQSHFLSFERKLLRPIVTSLELSVLMIAGVVEHRISDAFASQILLVNMLSFVARTINSYWGTQQWVDLARFSGLQSKNSKPSSYQIPDSTTEATVGCNTAEDGSIDEIKKQ
ncbi:hypothetical protein GH714_013895 [Hevea brasiliensis]|uniref:Uncharacterized protein n=1 Tax=Hevea brasiliensis TaxID=3981 RepID=A0A6A6N2X1_HEVBR|nr:hypothetical protein GH714_013895 [Hevea brasiliensis]